MREGTLDRVGSGTWALRLRKVAGDDLPDTDWQDGTLGVLGWVLYTQALLLVWSQATALQSLWEDSVWTSPMAQVLENSGDKADA